MPNSKEPVALTAVGRSTPTLAKFDPKSDKARWIFRRPWDFPANSRGFARCV